MIASLARSRWSSQSFAVAVGIACAGCADVITDPGPFFAAREAGTTDAPIVPATCTLTIDVPTAIFATRCSTAGCHTATTPAGSLDLLSPGVAQRLIGVHSATCAGLTLVSTDGASGFLFDKLRGTPRCGSPMPLGGTALTPAELDCVRAWTEAAAGGAGLDASAPTDASSAMDASDVPVRIDVSDVAARADVVDVAPRMDASVRMDASDAADVAPRIDAPIAADADDASDASDAAMDMGPQAHCDVPSVRTDLIVEAPACA